jgi:hypothetical protein
VDEKENSNKTDSINRRGELIGYFYYLAMMIVMAYVLGTELRISAPTFSDFPLSFLLMLLMECCLVFFIISLWKWLVKEIKSLQSANNSTPQPIKNKKQFRVRTFLFELVVDFLKTDHFRFLLWVFASVLVFLFLIGVMPRILFSIMFLPAMVAIGLLIWVQIALIERINLEWDKMIGFKHQNESTKDQPDIAEDAVLIKSEVTESNISMQYNTVDIDKQDSVAQPETTSQKQINEPTSRFKVNTKTVLVFGIICIMLVNLLLAVLYNSAKSYDVTTELLILWLLLNLILICIFVSQYIKIKDSE